MNVLTMQGPTREQVAAEVAEMRKAARAIAASPRKRLKFLRQVGVINSVGKNPRAGRAQAGGTGRP